MPIFQSDTTEDNDGKTIALYTWSGYLLYKKGTQELAIKQRFDSLQEATAKANLLPDEPIICFEHWPLLNGVTPADVTNKDIPGIAHDTFEDDCLLSEEFSSV